MAQAGLELPGISLSQFLEYQEYRAMSPLLVSDFSILIFFNHVLWLMVFSRSKSLLVASLGF